jgi:hypothetical protein
MSEAEIWPTADVANELAPSAGLADAQLPAVRDGKGRFLTGNSGGGRPKGSRNRLTDTFLSAIADDFATNGIDAIERVRKKDPAAYLKLVSSLIPRQLVLEREQETDFDDMTDDEIAQLFERGKRNQAVRVLLGLIGK